MNMPEFTAEAVFHAKSRTCYRGVYRSGSIACSGVVTQLIKINVPSPLYPNSPFGPQCYCLGPNCEYTYCPGIGGGDDPGGWGVPPWIGDVACRQCRARCNKLKNPMQKEDCLDSCPCD